MPSIPHGLSTAFSTYLPALLALGAAWASARACGAKARQAWLPVGATLACLLGWAALVPLSRLRAETLAPGLAPALLLIPAVAVAVVGAMRVWRGGRNERLLGVLAAALVGWWLARAAAGPGEFWRVWIVVAVSAMLVAWVVRQQAMRGLALGLALWGGCWAAGVPTGWVVASAVGAAAWAGLLAAGAGLVPNALVAGLLAGVDLARGRFARGHVGAVDIVCLSALAAPLLAGLLAPRLGKRWGAAAPVVGAAVAVALGWGLRRAGG